MTKKRRESYPVDSKGDRVEWGDPRATGWVREDWAKKKHRGGCGQGDGHSNGVDKAVDNDDFAAGFIALAGLVN